MGAKSTLDISREDALASIVRMLVGADDYTIANVLEELNDDSGRRMDTYLYLGLHNFRIREAS